MVILFVLAVFLLFAGGLAGFIYLIFWIARRQQQRRQAVWAAVAQAHGLAFTGDEIVGHRDGLQLRVCLEVRGSGKNRTTYTVVSVAARSLRGALLGGSVTR